MRGTSISVRESNFIFISLNYEETNRILLNKGKMLTQHKELIET